MTVGGNYPVTIDAAYTVSSVVLSGTGSVTFTGSPLTVTNAVTVGTGQTLAGSATLNAAIALSGGTLCGTLTVGSATAVGGSTFSPTAGGTLTIAGSLSADATTTYNVGIGGAFSTISVGSISGTLCGTLNVTAAGITGVGSYAVIVAPSGGWGVAPSINLTVTGTGLSNSLLTFGTPTASATAISVPVIRVPASFFWGGGGSGNWSTAAWDVGLQGGPSYIGIYPGGSTADVATIDLRGQSNPTITMDAPQTIDTLTLSNAGTLTLSGSNALSVTSAISLGSGVTQTLTGTGTINAPITMGGSGTLGGTLTVGGNLTTSAGDVIAPTSGSTLTIDGALDNGGATTYNLTIGTTSSKVLAGSITVLSGNIVVTAGTGIGIGTFCNLIAPTSGTWTAGAPSITSLAANGPNVLTYTLSSAATGISLTTARSTTAQAFTWAGGSGGGNWSNSAYWTITGVSYGGVYPGMVANDTVSDQPLLPDRHQHGRCPDHRHPQSCR